MYLSPNENFLDLKTLKRDFFFRDEYYRLIGRVAYFVNIEDGTMFIFRCSLLKWIKYDYERDQFNRI